MTTLAAILMAVTLFVVGGGLLLVSERKGPRAGRVFLGAIGLCAVIGLAVAALRTSGNPSGLPSQATSRTMVE